MASEKTYKLVNCIKNDSHNPGKRFQKARNLGQKQDIQRNTSQSVTSFCNTKYYLSGNRVITSFCQRMASQYSIYRKICSLYCSVFFQSFYSVRRTGRNIYAYAPSFIGRNMLLVNSYQKNKNFLHIIISMLRKKPADIYTISSLRIL